MLAAHGCRSRWRSRGFCPSRATPPNRSTLALARAASADLLLITGGVSAGKFDLVEPALARLGARFHFTGVRMQPGKPVVFGELPRGAVQPKRPPSNRAPPEPHRSAAFWGCRAIPSPPPSRSCSSPRPFWPRLPAVRPRSDRSGPRFASRASPQDVKTKPGLTRFLPAACTFTGTRARSALVPWQGSGDLAAMALANCYSGRARRRDSLDEGAMVRILLA
jgi:molybdopterin molybdotransferase